jgi:hypothetical protein
MPLLPPSIKGLKRVGGGGIIREKIYTIYIFSLIMPPPPTLFNPSIEGGRGEDY